VTAVEQDQTMFNGSDVRPLLMGLLGLTVGFSLGRSVLRRMGGRGERNARDLSALARVAVGVLGLVIMAAAVVLMWAGFRDPWTAQTGHLHGGAHGWATGLLGVGAAATAVSFLLIPLLPRAPR
jgi:hypothetical protein